MNEQVSFTLRGRNPDVLTCIANLSNDEVFTPPELANRMLDMVAEAWAVDHGGASLWAGKKSDSWIHSRNQVCFCGSRLQGWCLLFPVESRPSWPM